MIDIYIYGYIDRKEDRYMDRKIVIELEDRLMDVLPVHLLQQPPSSPQPSGSFFGSWCPPCTRCGQFQSKSSCLKINNWGRDIEEW